MIIIYCFIFKVTLVFGDGFGIIGFLIFVHLFNWVVSYTHCPHSFNPSTATQTTARKKNRNGSM